MTHRVANVCFCLLNCFVVSKAKDILDQKYYSGNVVESCQDIILYMLGSLIIDHTIELDNNTGHDYNCFHTIDIYFEERKRNMLPNEFIIYFWDLCNCCYYSCCFSKSDLIPYFRLAQND